MAALDFISRRGFVPNTAGGGAFGTLLNVFGTKQQRDEKARAEALGLQKAQEQEDALQLLEEGGAENEARALGRISTLFGPAVSNSIRQSLERGDKNQIAQNLQDSEDAFRFNTFLEGVPQNQRDRVIREEADRRLAQGKPIDKLVELSRKAPEEMEIEIQRRIIGASSISDLSKEKIRKLELAEKAQFEPITDQAGNIVGQRNITTGQVIADPRVGERFEPVRDQAGNVVAQRNTATGKVISDPRAIEQESKTTLVRNLEAIGISPDSPEGKRIVKQALLKPTTTVNVNDQTNGLFKLPIGTMLADRNDPTKGVVPIPGGPKDTLKAEQAAKVQMIRSALKAFNGDPELNRPSISDMVFGSDGSLNTGTLLAAGLNVPFTQGRDLRQRMEFGIQAITRGETGAAMPPEEVENTRLRFMPKVGDSVEGAKLKLELFKDFLSGTLKLINPQGRFDDERFQTEFDKRLKKSRGKGESTVGRFNVRIKQ